MSKLRKTLRSGNMETSEALKHVEEFAKKFQLVIGSIGFSETGELEKVYLFKSRARSPANSHSTHTRGEASAFIVPSPSEREGLEAR